jgi:hypothetical protein
MTSKQDLIDRINKVRNLALKGVGGEQENARDMVEKMMSEYGISEAELDLETEQIFTWFRYQTQYPLSKRLLGQVIFSVVGDRVLFKEDRKTKLGMDCTKAEAIEIRAKYHFYKTIIADEIQVFFLAFANKHDLFPPEKIRPKTGRSSGVDRSKIIAMMNALDDHSFRTQIGTPGGEDE